MSNPAITKTYSNNIVVNKNFVIKIPEGAPLDKIAPILCAE